MHQYSIFFYGWVIFHCTNLSLILRFHYYQGFCINSLIPWRGTEKHLGILVPTLLTPMDLTCAIYKMKCFPLYPLRTQFLRISIELYDYFFPALKENLQTCVSILSKLDFFSLQDVKVLLNILFFFQLFQKQLN